MAFYLRMCFYIAREITSLYWRLIGHRRHTRQYFALVELVIFEYVKLGYIWTNNFIFSKLCVCCEFTIEKKQNMCKLVKVELESFCQIGNGSWPVVQTIAMVLEIIGRNNNYPLRVSSIFPWQAYGICFIWVPRLERHQYARPWQVGGY